MEGFTEEVAVVLGLKGWAEFTRLEVKMSVPLPSSCHPEL